MTFFESVKDKAQKAWDSVDKFEMWVGRGKMLDDRIDEQLEKVCVQVPKIIDGAKEKVEKIRDKAPLCLPIKKEKPKAPGHVPPAQEKDIWDVLSQDEALAAALRYVYMHPCIKVRVRTMPKDRVAGTKDKPCNTPFVKVKDNPQAALKRGIYKEPGLEPAPKAPTARVVSFISRFTKAPLVKCL